MIFAALLATTDVTPPRPVGDPRSWIKSEDYPASALQADADGPTRVALSIDATGHVTGCVIEVSSGNAELDATTCKLLQQRATFSPARNAAGVAVSAKLTHQIRWRIPREQLISQGFRMTYSLDAAGHITGCKIDEFGGHDPDLTCSPQNIEQIAASYLAYPLSRYSTVSILLAVEVDDETKINVLRAEGMERKVAGRAHIQVSREGVITGCTSSQPIEYGGRSVSVCEMSLVGTKQFDPNPAGKTRELTVSLEIAGDPRQPQ